MAFAFMAGLLSIAVGVIGLSGWGFHIAALTTLFPGMVSIKVNTTICLILVGISLCAQVRAERGQHPANALTRYVAKAAAAVPAVVGAISLGEALFGWDVGIDQRLLAETPAQAVGAIRPGLMSPITAIDLTLLGIALLCLDWKRWQRFWLPQLLCLLAGLAASIGILNYTLEPRVYHTFIAPQTAVTLFVFSFGVICSRTDYGFAKLLASTAAGGVLVRRLLPAAFVFPVLIGWVRWAEFKGNAEQWAGGTVMIVGMIVLLAGITIWTAHVMEDTDRERRRSEEALRESEYRYRSVVENLPVKVFVKDKSSVYVSCNQRFAQELGIQPNEFAGKTDFDFFPPALAEKYRSDDKQIMQSGSTREYEEQYLHSGQKRVVQTIKAALKDEKGIPIGLVGIFWDITDRKQAEEKVREQAALLDLAHDAILVRDLAGVISFWNRGAQNTYGWTAAEALGRVSHDLLQTEFPSPIEEIEAVLHDRGVWEGELAHVDKQGRPLIVASRWSLLHDKNGVPKAALEINRDIGERKQAEEALRRSEARLQLQFDRMPVACIVWSHDFRVLSWNPAAETTFGFTAAEVVGKHKFECIVTKDVQPQVEHIYHRLLDGDSHAHITNDNLTKDGRLITCQWTNTPLKDSDGAVVGILSMVQDITAKKKAEAQVRRASLYARSLLEASLDPLVTISKEGRIMDVNRAAELVTGISRERLIGSDFSDYFTEPEKARSGYQKVFAQGSVQDYPLVIRHASGKLTDVMYNATVYRNEAGEIEGVFAAARDITAAKKAQEAVAAERQRLNGILEVLPAYVVLLTPDYHVPFANRIFRERFGDSHGKRCFEYLFGRTEPCEICETYKVLKTGAPGVWEWTGPDGREYDIYDFPFTDSDGSTLILEMGIDITARKRAEAQIRQLNNELEDRVKQRTAELEAANAELEAFTYSVSHDLRSPLRHIAAFSKMLSEEFNANLPNEAQHYLERIREGTLRMGLLVDDLLNLGRVGRHALRLQVTGLNSVVEQVITDLAQEAQGREIEWKIGSLPFVECDPALVRQVFNNLLSNALKFTRPRAKALVEVGQTTIDGTAVIFVRDNGVGFSMKYADKLFGVFQRLHRSEDFEGTGVGLATVQRIVQRHGGRIWAEAELDRGAIFYLTLATSESTERKTTIATAGGAV